MQIGLAGVGRMGAAIVARLMEVGHTLAVWNRSADKTKPLAEAGAKVAATPAELAKASEVIISILTDAAAIDAVYNGASGLLSGDVKGKLFIEMSTVQPGTAIALSEKVHAKGAGFVDAPVGGTVGPARQGKLIGFMGGSDADAARARPILEQLCRRLEHCGPVGAGCSVKLAINLPLMIYWQACGEAVSLCQHVGVDPVRLMDIFADTSGGPNFLKQRGPVIAKVLSGGDAGATAFDIDSARKDMRTMLAEAKLRGAELPLIERTLATFDAASRAGLGPQDQTNIPAFFAHQWKKS
ncbi:MAG TPA: NAD(P)-dependent oxidoreductase [Pseudolabrys sp.]|nr:NAD(P)-dependent oxidoreductase [Pseudolabrys sp.]